MQSGVIRDGEPWGLPVDLKIQPQYFKDLGYSTHMVGKVRAAQAVVAEEEGIL